MQLPWHSCHSYGCFCLNIKETHQALHLSVVPRLHVLAQHVHVVLACFVQVVVRAIVFNGLRVQIAVAGTRRSKGVFNGQGGPARQQHSGRSIERWTAEAGRPPPTSRCVRNTSFLHFAGSLSTDSLGAHTGSKREQTVVGPVTVRAWTRQKKRGGARTSGRPAHSLASQGRWHRCSAWPPRPCTPWLWA